MNNTIYFIKGKAVIHFLTALTDKEYLECEERAKASGDMFTIDTKYDFAIHKAKKFGGKKFHNKHFGGGIAFNTTQELNTFLQTIQN